MRLHTMEIFILYIGLCIVAWIIADSKGRSGIGYFALAFFLSPLIGLLLAICLPKLEDKTEVQAQ